MNSGVGWAWLVRLSDVASQSRSRNWRLDAQVEARILDLVNEVLYNYPFFKLSGEIRRLVGQARFYARAGMPSSKRGFFRR